MPQELTHQTELQGSSINIEHCANCGTEMLGAYCSRCGQATRHFIRFFPAVVREIIEDTLDIDGRFGRTIWTIMFRPGRATQDFLKGKRVHYTPPFRLYLFTSLLAFLLLSIEAGNINQHFDTVNTASEQTPTKIQADGHPLSTDNQTPSASDAATVSGPQEDQDANDIVITFHNGEWDPVTNPIAIGWLPQSINNLFNNAVSNIKNNVPQIKQNPGILIEKVIQLLPQTLFVLLPIFALILKCFYLFAKRYYMEHLIYSVHIHTFTLMILIMVTALDMLANKLPDSLQLACDIGQGVLLTWFIVYLFIAQKCVYQQSWLFTFVKYNAIYFTYSILQTIAISIVIIIGAATL